MRLAQADAGPRGAAVGRLVHARAARFLTGADVDHLRIGRRDSHRANRRGLDPVEDGLPGLSRVCCLPHAAGGRAQVVGVRIGGVHGAGRHPPCAERPDQPPAKRAEQSGGDGLGERHGAPAQCERERQGDSNTRHRRPPWGMAQRQAGADPVPQRMTDRRARMCAGVVPQQPPMICTPASSSSGALAATSSGVSGYTVAPFLMTGRPALA
jgi:hypothetical protein